MLRYAATMLVLVQLLLASSVTAQPGRTASPAATARARAAFEQGSRLYARGRYRDAMAAFEEAYAAVNSPEFLYNIYTSAQQAGELVAAENALSAYLASRSVPEDERPALEARLVLLRREIAAAAAEEAARAQQLEDAEGRALAAERQAALGGPRVSPAATAAFVVGAGGLASFVTFAALATHEDRRIGRECGAAVGALCAQSEVRRLRAYSITADVSLGIGTVGAAAGLILFLLERKRRADILRASPEPTDSAGAVRVAPVLGGPADTWGLVVEGTF